MRALQGLYARAGPPRRHAYRVGERRRGGSALPQAKQRAWHRLKAGRQLQQQRQPRVTALLPIDPIKYFLTEFNYTRTVKTLIVAV